MLNVNKMTWILSKINVADPLTKKDSPLINSLQLMLFTGEISVNIEECKTLQAVQSTG